MAGDVTPSEASRILTHLLSDCAACREITGPLAPFGRTSLSENPDEGSEAAAAAESADAATTARLLERLRGREQAIQNERHQATALLAELESAAHAHRLLLVRNSSRFHTWGLAELLVDESFRHRFDDPQLTRELAELGIEVAQRLDPVVYGEATVNDLRARAWAMRGNSLRIGSDLRAAARCFTHALKLLEHGTGDPLEEARVCELFAALRSNQRRVEQAVRLQERAMRLYRRCGQRERLGKSLVDLASYNALAGDRERAIALVEKALELVDAERDAHTVLAARHNLAVFLQESGRLREALAVLDQARALHEYLGDRRNLLRLRWLEGRIARELGELQQAEEAFEDVYRGFADDTPIAAALAALDLALIYIETGRSAEVAAVVMGVEMVFRTQEVEPGAMAAWVVLREAVTRQNVHDALIKNVARRLEILRDRGGR
jgi:tetratricopeptide (TPR) repeat protein